MELDQEKKAEQEIRNYDRWDIEAFGKLEFLNYEELHKIIWKKNQNIRFVEESNYCCGEDGTSYHIKLKEYLRMRKALIDRIQEEINLIETCLEDENITLEENVVHLDPLAKP